MMKPTLKGSVYSRTAFAFIRQTPLRSFCKFLYWGQQNVLPLCARFWFLWKEPWQPVIWRCFTKCRAAQMLLLCVELSTALAPHLQMDFMECSHVVHEHQENRINSSAELSDLCLQICEYVLMCVTHFRDLLFPIQISLKGHKDNIHPCCIWKTKPVITRSTVCRPQRITGAVQDSG